MLLKSKCSSVENLSLLNHISESGFNVEGNTSLA